jgi:rhodanese-related sulfurtransferase/DNA-directed RNA polymerase subunit RPC12/RpoP
MKIKRMKSHLNFNKVFVIFGFIFFVLTHVMGQSNKQAEVFYQCLPCGSACDTLSFKQPGKCPHCHMELVKKSAIHLGSIEPSRICKYINEHPTVLLLDVRTKEEFEGKADPDYGTLKNAVNIPIQQLESRLSQLNAYKNREIIVYCSHSQRSPRAGYLLLQNGFTNVTNMTGGLSVMKDKACKK